MGYSMQEHVRQNQRVKVAPGFGYGNEREREGLRTRLDLGAQKTKPRRFQRPNAIVYLISYVLYICLMGFWELGFWWVGWELGIDMVELYIHFSWAMAATSPKVYVTKHQC